MKNFDYYNCNDLCYPSKPKKVSLSSSTPSEDEVRRYLELKANYDAEVAIYEKAEALYNEESSKRYSEFWKDAREHLGYDHYNEAVWQKCCSKAWEDGHSSGYSEVYNELSNLCDFVDQIMEALK